MDRAGARVQLLRLKAGPFPAPRHVLQKQGFPRAIPAELRHHQVQSAGGVRVDGPDVGHSSQARGQHDLLEPPAAPILPEPHHPAEIVVPGRVAAQVGHQQIDRPVGVEVARLDVAGVVQSGQVARRALRGAEIERGHLAQEHVARQEDRRLLGTQRGPAQPGYRRSGLRAWIEVKAFRLEGRSERGIGLLRLLVGDRLRGARAVESDDAPHGRRLQVGAPRLQVIPIALFHFDVPCVAGEALGARHGMAIAAKRANPRLDVGVDRHALRLLASESAVRLLRRALGPPLPDPPRDRPAGDRGGDEDQDRPGPSDSSCCHRLRKLSE